MEGWKACQCNRSTLLTPPLTPNRGVHEPHQLATLEWGDVTGTNIKKFELKTLNRVGTARREPDNPLGNNPLVRNASARGGPEDSI